MAGRREKDAPASEDDGNQDVQARSGTLKGGHDPAEMGRRSAAARRERAAQRAQEELDATRTFRQRLGIALSRLTQEELDAAVKAMATEASKGGKPAAMGALARIADQAFGKPLPEEGEDPDAGEDVRKLSRAQRSALIAQLLEEQELDGKPSGDSTDPRDDPPSPTPPHPPE